MPDTVTTAYGLTKPEIGASEDTWGEKINTDLDTLDTVVNAIGGKTAAGTLSYADSAKLSTTASGVDVTGDITLGDTNPTITFNDSSVTNLSHAVRSASDNLQLAVDVNGVDAGSRVEIFDGATEVARFSAGAVDITGVITTDGMTTSAVIKAPDGSAAAPAYTNSGDADGGMYFPAANQVAFATGGAERMRIDSSGNVGIGTSSTSTNYGAYKTPLIVEQSSGYGYVEIRSGSAANQAGLILNRQGNTGWLQAMDNNGKLKIAPMASIDQTGLTNAKDGSTGITVDTSGRIGIGTISPDANSGLTVESSTTSGQIMIKGSSGGNAGIALRASGQTTNFSIYENSGANLVFQKHATERMRITSSGSVGIGTSSPTSYNSKADDLVVQTSGDTGMTIVSAASSEGALAFANGTSGSGPLRGRIRYTHSTDEMDFRVNNAEAMRIDSSGNVGIGSSSPGMLLEVDASSGSANDIARFSGRNSGGLTLRNATANEFVLHTATSDALIFGTNGNNERMRIDASGNLLVGKTSIGLSTTGIDLRSNGLLQAIRDGATVVELNRQTSDGTIIDFRKDNSTVGSIMSYAGDMVTGTGDVGLRWEDAGDLLTPWNPSTNLPRASAIDLGASSVPFKDLYLSGGVYLGGTGSANKLDDYEEGTWTPGIRFGASTAGSLSAVGGSYTKIGRQVTVNVAFSVSNLNGGSGSAFVTGFPFTAADTVANTSIEGQGLVGYYSDLGESVSGMGVGILNNGTVAEVYKYNSSTLTAAANQTTLQVGADIRFSLTYFTS